MTQMWKAGSLLTSSVEMRSQWHVVGPEPSVTGTLVRGRHLNQRRMPREGGADVGGLCYKARRTQHGQQTPAPGGGLGATLRRSRLAGADLGPLASETRRKRPPARAAGAGSRAEGGQARCEGEGPSSDSHEEGAQGKRHPRGNASFPTGVSCLKNKHTNNCFPDL